MAVKVVPKRKTKRKAQGLKMLRSVARLSILGLLFIPVWFEDSLGDHAYFKMYIAVQLTVSCIYALLDVSHCKVPNLSKALTIFTAFIMVCFLAAFAFAVLTEEVVETRTYEDVVDGR